MKREVPAKKLAVQEERDGCSCLLAAETRPGTIWKNISHASGSCDPVGRQEEKPCRCENWYIPSSFTLVGPSYASGKKNHLTYHVKKASFRPYA